MASLVPSYNSSPNKYFPTNGPASAGGIIGGSEEAALPSNPSAALARRRSLAAQLARQRLKKAARYARAGLAVAPPFVANVSLGECSLEAFLSHGGVEWKQ